MKKRISSITAMMLIAMVAFGGCGSNSSTNTDAEQADSTESGGSTDTAKNSTEEKGTDELTTLTIWQQEYDGMDYETCLMTKVLEEKFHVNLDFVTFSSAEDVATQFNLSIASGEYPDIYSRIWFSSAQVLSCAANGVIIPLNDYIYADSGSNYKTALDENDGWENMVTANDGNIYTFFYTDTGVHKASEYKMWYRQDWLDKLGWTAAPSTPEEFKQYLIDIRDNDVNGNGDTTDEIPLMGYYGGRQTDPICFLMNPFELYTSSYYYITDDNQIHFSATSDGWRKGLSYIADLYQEGLIAEETYVQDQSTFKGILNKTEDEALVGTFPAWYNGAEIDTSVMSWFTYEPLAPLAGDYQQTAARIGGNFNLTGAISSQCKNPDIAFELLDYLVGDEGSKLGTWGVEGETYEIVDEPSYQEESTSVKYLVDSTASYLWNSGYFPRYDKESIRYAYTNSEDTIETDNTYVLLHAAQTYEPYYVNHNIPDVVWCDDVDVTQAVTDYASMIGEYIHSMDTQFIMGKLDINDDAAWQSYLEELDAMGLQDYISKLSTYYGLD